MEETISLQEIIDILKKHLKLIVITTLLFIVVSALISYFYLTPIYQSSTQFIVNEQKRDGDTQLQIDSGTIRTNIELINTYNVIITSSAILDVVIDNLNLPYAAETLKKKITVASEQNSQVVTVTVKDPDPILATDIANETVGVFQDKLPEIMNIDNVSILSQAYTPVEPKPVEPNKQLNIAIAGVIGFMLGVGGAFLIEFLDTKIRNENDIEAVGLTVIGTIFTIDAEDIRKDPSHPSLTMNRKRR